MQKEGNFKQIKLIYIYIEYLDNRHLKYTIYYFDENLYQKLCQA